MSTYISYGKTSISLAESDGTKKQSIFIAAKFPFFMGILSDKDIKEFLKTGEIVIQEMQDDQVGSCSVDLRLGSTFRVFKHAEVTHVYPKHRISHELLPSSLATRCRGILTYSTVLPKTNSPG